MEFATFIRATQRGYHQTSDSVIHDAIEQTVLSEQAGFDTAWFAEHHFNNYSLVPSPLMMVAHCAGVTKRIRLGTAVCVLPLYQPQRLLAEIGFADVVSNGRLELGVGSGYQQFEFERFGVNIDNAPAVFSNILILCSKVSVRKSSRTAATLCRSLRLRSRSELFKSPRRRSGSQPVSEQYAAGLS